MLKRLWQQFVLWALAGVDASPTSGRQNTARRDNDNDDTSVDHSGGWDHPSSSSSGGGDVL